ncbi:ubiquitin-conjugating enzyme E2 M [Paragonimus westermani]|uniref:Ubiquitin-conjugating enzyme E2 M n=1 Tax=Paragonimus westermani TaxID=34504 RepID=A0A5J4NM69_9TREM|nr:ubiquitin-conjugating enzyme E2 M [Paragonimus westermani]
MLSIEKDDQLKIVDYDEQHLTQFFISVTPSGGLYAHAQFIFQITSSDVYPEEPPKVRCITPIFHPNIDDPSRNGDTCINLFNYWSKGFSLKDVANAVLFLFYQPNFDDPLNSSVPDEGETVVDCILQSLIGGEIHGVHYPPNKFWCAWKKQNPNASIFGHHKILEWKNEITDNPDTLLNGMEKSVSFRSTVDRYVIQLTSILV